MSEHKYSFMYKLQSSPCYIIAEAGVNHNGDKRLALELISKAKECGADAVKFQTYRASELSAPGAHRDMLAALQIPLEWYAELIKEAERVGIDFLSSAFDYDSASFLCDIGVRAIKIPSGEIRSTQFVTAVAKLGRPLIISTGMCGWDVTDAIHQCLGSSFDVAWLQCVSCYPAKAEDYNLRIMDELHRRYGKTRIGGHGVVGISDHTLDDTLPIAAAGRGAQIIEKHFTTSRDLAGPDHAMSMDPTAFGSMVAKVRSISNALARDQYKAVLPCEEATVRKSIRQFQGMQYWRIPAP